MTLPSSIFSHSPLVVTRKTGNEYVIVPIADNIADMNRVYTLNETGAFIWDQIDGKKSIDEIIEALVAEFEVEHNEAEQDVFSFVEELKSYLTIREQDL
jgi:methyltransferase-like protein